ncbi:MAG: hypothetical protein AAF502_09840 [Bacteroidota bacterium]
MPTGKAFDLNIELDYWADNIRREGTLSESQIGDLQLQLLDDMDQYLELNYPEEQAFALAVRSLPMVPVARKKVFQQPKTRSSKYLKYQRLQKYHSYMFIGIMLYIVLAGIFGFLSKGFLAFMAVGPIASESLPVLDMAFKATLIGGILIYINPFLKTANRWIVNIYQQLTTTPFYFLFSGACFIFLAYWLNMVMNIALGIFVSPEYLALIAVNKTIFDMTFLSIVLCAYSALLVRGTQKQT